MYKSRSKVSRVLLLAIAFTLMFSMVAFADDAVMDILDQPRFGGAVQWVNKIGKIVDNWFMAVISFVSFFIISASCLRNVLAGAYCVFPKFWDGVHDAHQMTDQLSISSAISGFKGATNWQVGSISKFLMGLLPDIKVLTDFENAEKDSIDYKQYFMKAIPQCVVAVFVGVFIYNGLYRDVMSVTSRFGVAVADNALKSVKPDVILEQLTNISVNINYPIKDAPYGTDMIADTWLKETVGYVYDIYDDQYKKTNKQKMYNLLSDWASSTFGGSEFDAYQNTNQWVPKTEKRGAGIGTTIPSGMSEGVNAIASGQEGLKVFCVVCPVHNLGLDTTVQSNGYLWGYIALEDQGYTQGKDGDIAVQDMSLVVFIPGSMSAGGSQFPTDGVTFQPNGNTYLSGTGTFTYGGVKFEISQNTTNGNGSITIKQSGTGQIEWGKFLQASGNAPTYNGQQVRQIRFAQSNDDTCKAEVMCLFSGGNPAVRAQYGADLGEKIAQAKRAAASANGGNASGGNDSSNNENEDDEGLDDAD